MTPSGPDHKISPESSDGFASVGTILPRGKAALLPGGLFVFARRPSEPRLYARRERRYNPKRYVRLRRADVAQLVEQLIRNQQVIGSSPIVGSKKYPKPFAFLVPAPSLVPAYPLFFLAAACDH